MNTKLFNKIDALRRGRLALIINYFGSLHLAVWNWFLSYFPSYRIRRFTLKHLYGVQIGRNVNVHMGVKLLKPWNIVIGDNVNIQLGCFIDGRGGLYIGNNVDITIGVKILTQQHNMQDSEYETVSRPVRINDNSVIGSFALLLPGVTIGTGSVIGAGSVVARSIPDWTIAVGNPCTIKRARNREINYRIGFARPFH